MNVLIVRLGALGDIVHAIPAAAALRAALPGARIDWLVEAKHRSILDLLTVLDSVVALEGRTLRAWTDVVRRARQARYDVAFDFQGLMKSALLARASGASRVAGFSIWHLREKTARPFYSETDDTEDNEAEHVIQKNLHLLQYWNSAANGWKTATGVYKLTVGSSFDTSLQDLFLAIGLG